MMTLIMTDSDVAKKKKKKKAGILQIGRNWNGPKFW